MNIFTVVSEFRFDIAHALLGSQQLQSSVDGISGSVNNAIMSMQSLGLGIISQFSGLQSGLAGLMGSALYSTDKFMNSQLSFTQIIDSNMEHLTGTIGTMNDKMAVSKVIMQDIANDAMKFGVPASDLLQMTNKMSAMLAPKGLAGTNFSEARNLSRNLLKSSANLSIDPTEVQGQLLRAIEGSASMGDTLFRRLISEAPESFKAKNVKDAKGFNQLDDANRFNVISEAMKKFANNGELLAMRANTLSGIMQRAKDTFAGFNSVMRPLGEVIMPLIVDGANYLLNWVNTKGRNIIKTFAAMLKPLADDPIELIKKMAQAKSLSKDFKHAVEFTGLFMIISHALHLFRMLKNIPVIGPMASGLVDFFKNLKIIEPLMNGLSWVFANFATVLRFIWPLIRTVVVGLLEFTAGIFAFLIPLQGLSRAIARMKIETLQWIADNLDSLTATFSRMSFAIGLIFSPIEDLIKGWEELFFTILGGTYVLDGAKWSFETLADVMMFLGNAMMFVLSGFRGLAAGIIEFFFTIFMNIRQMIGNIFNGNFANMDLGTENSFSNFGKAFMEEFDKSFKRAQNPLNADGVDNSKVVSQVNNYDVKMNNSFKEVLEPDRIAFTIKDQLEKSNTYRGQARAKGTSAMLSKAF